MLAEPSASVVRVSTAPSAIPADTATCDPTPCAESAKATAALETPTLPGRQRQDPGQVERRDDQDGGCERPVDPEGGCDRGRGGDAERHREPDPAGDLRRGLGAAPEDAEDVESSGRTSSPAASHERARRLRLPPLLRAAGPRSASAAARRPPRRARARRRATSPAPRSASRRSRRPSRAARRCGACVRRARTAPPSRSGPGRARSRSSRCSSAQMRPTATPCRRSG